MTIIISRKRRIAIKRYITLFMLFTILNQVLAPSIALALTSGPTAPEATSFEPIDTTDMVNPLTGDLTYGLPLLEVPGPEGGYPLALSYHAGIQPNEEASWVGLGWSLNPGAITRNVNGYADDFSDVGQGARSYWVGGERSTFGINVGLPSGVIFGLSFSQDTYQGFGVGMSMGFGHSFGPIGLDFTSGVDAFGQPYGGASIGLGYSTKSQGGVNAGASIGISTNFSTVNTYAGGGVSYKTANNANISLLGASISSVDSKVSLSVGGGSAGVYNANAGRIQTESSGFSFGIPLPGGFSIGLKANKTRYWSDESTTVNTNGSLYIPQSIGTQSYLAERTFDVYDLQDLEDSPDNNFPDNLKGGLFPDYDNYYVSAQGLSGNIRPYVYQSILYRQNRHITLPGDDADVYDDTSIGAPSQTTYSKVQYRFINDFSNSITQAPADLANSTTIAFGSPTHGNQYGIAGLNSTTGQLAGSKHIAYFTNESINAHTAQAAGFIDTKSAGFIRMGNTNALSNLGGNKQVGGYVITNASGVNYHYALPAYAYNEFSKTSSDDGSTFTSSTRNEPYAYTWYLTAITGPDFVDRNNDGFADEGDWGYWVNFDYGKWTENFGWRNPAQGNHVDLNPKYKSYSRGTKELYYLDAIKTRSHTAIFEKEMRADAKSVVIPLDNALNLSDNSSFLSATSIPRICPAPTDNSISNLSKNITVKSTLRLKSILLYQNDQLTNPLNTIRAAGTSYNQSVPYSTVVCSIIGDIHGNGTIVPHHGENVIDKYDISQDMINNCLRRITFGHDYSLCPGVPNSYDPEGTNTYTSTPQTPTEYLGKLTLQSIDFQGKGGISVTPPITFKYDYDRNDPNNQGSLQITSNSGKSGNININNNNVDKHFATGDIVVFTQNAITYYCTLKSTSDNINFDSFCINQPSMPNSGAPFIAYKTKNPPYNKDAYDIWGSYKSDYVSIADNENLSRLTTKASNQAADVWSLRKVQTSLGAEIDINYEGDTYNKSVLTNSRSLIVNDASFNSNYTILYANLTNPTNVDLSHIYTVGGKIRGALILNRTLSRPNQSSSGQAFVNFSLYPNCTITNINGNAITIDLDPLLTLAFSNPQLLSDPFAPVSQQNPDLWNIVNLSVVTGNIISSNLNLTYGGGIRVKDITVNNLNGQVKRTAYTYNMLDMSANERISSGVTSYEPVSIDIDKLDVNGISGWLRQYYKYALNQDMSLLLPIAREVPAPGVMYEYVTISESSVLPNGSSVPIDGPTTYQYRVFNKGMVGLHPNILPQTSGSVTKRNISIKDYTSQIGNLLRVIKYDLHENKLTETVNHFLNDDIVENSFQYQVANYDSRLTQFNNQGMIQERYANASKFSSPSLTRWVMNFSGRDETPVVQTGSTYYDYKNNTKMSSQNLGFDFYNGTVNKSLTTDSYGNRFINEVNAAYHYYPALGLKSSSADNGNMLTQTASNYTFTIDGSNNPIGVVTAKVQTWGNTTPVLDPDGTVTTDGQSKIWRMVGNYDWMPAGTAANNVTPYSSFADYFSSTNGGSNNTSWKKTNEITKYNVYSAGLEAKDINNNHAATRMGYGNSKILITGSPAKYNEIAFSGTEDALLTNGNFSNNINKGSGTIVATTAHTGTKSLSVGANQTGFNYTVAKTQINAKSYSVSVWVKADDGGVPTSSSLYYQEGSNSAVTPTQTYNKVAAGWYLLEMTIPASAVGGSGNLTIGCKNNSSLTQYFDDFRVQPTVSKSSAYVYDQLTGELNYVLDNNNLYTHYQYDAIGRLTNVSREILGKTNVPIVKTINYNYAKSHTNSNGSNPNSNQTIYVRLEQTYPYAPTYTGNMGDELYYIHSYSNLDLHFYADAACTIPLVLTQALTVNVNEHIYGTFNNNVVDDLNNQLSIPVSPGQSVFNIFTQLEHQWENYTTEWNSSIPAYVTHYAIETYNYSLLPSGNTYVIVN